MKNIHILPTVHPSRLSFDFDIQQYYLQKESSFFEHQDIIENRNTYITSDEEIKDCNCYVINAVGVLDKMNVFKPIKVTEEIVRKEPLITYPNGGWCKKIILTTDEDLIKDGVQAIDDEFLEWFVKNPKCEFVEVIKETELDAYYRNGVGGTSLYKIIIPKEESMSYEEFRENSSNDLIRKFDTDCSRYSEDGDSDSYFYSNSKYWENKLKEEPKQETLEEVAEKYASGRCTPPAIMHKGLTDAIKFGAKWQQEQEQEKNKFSKEDLERAFKNGFIISYGIQDVNSIDRKDDYFKEWFEQFKKK